MTLRLTLLAVLVMAAGCSSTGIVPADKDTFYVSKTNGGGVFGNADNVLADLYVEANQHCAKSGKAVETVEADAQHAIPFVTAGGAKLRFRCIAKVGG